jgi:hypothetical protein
MPLAGVAFISFTFAHEVGLDEIIVTAIKREGTVQDVPSNIAALDGQRIDQQGFNKEGFNKEGAHNTVSLLHRRR